MCACAGQRSPSPGGTAGGHRPGQQPQGSERPCPHLAPLRPLPRFPQQSAALRTAVVLRDGDSDSKNAAGEGSEGGFGTGTGSGIPGIVITLSPAPSWDAQLLARGGSWPPCPGPSPARGGRRPGGDSDPCGEVAAQSSRWLPVTASPGTAQAGSPPRPHSPFLGGWRRGRNRPHGSRGDKGGRGPAAEGNVPCPRPRSQGSGYPVPRQPEPRRSFSRRRHSCAPRGWGQREGAAEGSRAGGLRGLGREVAAAGCSPGSKRGGGGYTPKHPWEQGGGWMQPKALPGTRGGCTPKHCWEQVGDGCTPKPLLGARGGECTPSSWLQLAGRVPGAMPLQAASPACPGCEGCQEGPAQWEAAAGTFLPAGRVS